MKGFFSLESPLFRFIDTVANIFILTVIWTICSIPIVTIGASTTALFYVTLRMVHNEESYVSKNFWKGFRTNFKQATLLWLRFIPFILLLGFAYYSYFYMMKDLAPSWILPLLIAFTLFLTAYMMYAFALLARYENTNAQILKNAMILMFKYLVRTILMMFAIGILLVVFLWNRYTHIFGLLFGMGAIVYVVSTFMIRIFEILERDYVGKNMETDSGEYTEKDNIEKAITEESPLKKDTLKESSTREHADEGIAETAANVSAENAVATVIENTEMNS